MTGIIFRSFMSGCHCRSSDLPKHLVSAVIIDVDSVNMPVMGMGDCAERVYQPISRNLMDLFSFILMCLHVGWHQTGTDIKFMSVMDIEHSEYKLITVLQCLLCTSSWFIRINISRCRMKVCVFQFPLEPFHLKSLSFFKEKFKIRWMVCMAQSAWHS